MTEAERVCMKALKPLPAYLDANEWRFVLNRILAALEEVIPDFNRSEFLDLVEEQRKELG